jgi:hypothetical protein
MGLGRCHFTSAMIKAIAVDDGGGGGLWIVEAEGKNRNSPREEARRQAGEGRAGRRGRNCVSCGRLLVAACWLVIIY